jgi:hypothetical protein
LISPSLSNAQSNSKVQTKLVASLHYVKMAMNILKSCKKFEVSNRFQNAKEFGNKIKQNFEKREKRNPSVFGLSPISLPPLSTLRSPAGRPSSTSFSLPNPPGGYLQNRQDHLLPPFTEAARCRAPVDRPRGDARCRPGWL